MSAIDYKVADRIAKGILQKRGVGGNSYDDIIQESRLAFLTAAARRDPSRSEGEFVVFVQRHVFGAVVSQLKKQRPETTFTDLGYKPPESPYEHEFPEDGNSLLNLLEDELLAGDVDSILSDKAIDKEEIRETVMLYFRLGLTYEEIAEWQGLSCKEVAYLRVKNVISKFRKKLSVNPTRRWDTFYSKNKGASPKNKGQ